MCGQAGFHRRTARRITKLNELADELLLAIESRGHDAAGFLAMMDSGKVQMEKEPRPASKFIRGRGLIHRDARTVLLHTRFATVGARTLRNAHPVVSGPVAAVHNGTIYNASEIFSTFDLPRKAEVDSEVIPALIHHVGWDQAADAFPLMEGGAATAVVSSERPKEVILARLRSYPMVVGTTRDLVIWASTAEAILRAWMRVYRRPFPGKIETLSEATMLLVNGKVERIALKMPKPKPKKYLAPRPRYATARPTPLPATRPSKSQRKRAARNGGRNPRPNQTALRLGYGLQQAGPPAVSYGYGYPIYRDDPTEAETLSFADRAQAEDELAIRDLMELGMTRAEAEAAIDGEGRWDSNDIWTPAWSTTARS